MEIKVSEEISEATEQSTINGSTVVLVQRRKYDLTSKNKYQGMILFTSRCTKNNFCFRVREISISFNKSLLVGFEPATYVRRVLASLGNLSIVQGTDFTVHKRHLPYACACT